MKASEHKEAAVNQEIRIGGYYLEACESCGDPLASDTDGCSCTPAAGIVLERDPRERFAIVTPGHDSHEVATAQTFSAARRACEVLLAEGESHALIVLGPNDEHLGRWENTERGVVRYFDDTQRAA